MTLPRMSIHALAAQAQLEPDTLITLVEGQSDRSILTYVSQKENLPISVYFIGDIEINLLQAFAKYGGNKGRVASAIYHMESLADENLIGIIDLDNDEILYKKVELKGLYYTKFCCLMSFVLSVELLRDFIQIIAGKAPSQADIENVVSISRRLFSIRCLRDLFNSSADLPQIKRYVDRSKKHMFDIQRFAGAVSHNIDSSLSAADVLEIIDIPLDVDVRAQTHLHSTLEWLRYYLKESRLISRLITEEEARTEIKLFYIMHYKDCPMWAIIRNKSLKLIAV